MATTKNAAGPCAGSAKAPSPLNEAPGARGRARGLRGSEYPLHVVSLVLFFAIWQWAGSRIPEAGAALATPTQVMASLADLYRTQFAGLTLPGHIWASAVRVLAGFAIAVALGIPAGLGMAYSPVFRALFNPIFCLLKPMPPLAWISVAILWMGIGEAPKIFIIVLGSLIPVILNSYNGLLLIDEEMYDVVRMLGGNRWDRIRLVSAPAALPSIGAGLQIAISVAWGSVVAAEMVSSRSGLGFIIMQGMKISDPGMIISGMVVIALLAFLSSLLVEALLRRVCVWQHDIDNL